MGAFGRVGRSLNGAVHRVEKTLAGSLFLVMAAVMLVYVLHRVFSRPEGRLSLAAIELLGGLGIVVSPATAHGPLSLALNLAIAFGISFAMLRTMTRTPPLSRGRAAGLALVATAALAAGVKLILVGLPNGLIWGPRFALACLLWIGFLGASIATFEKRHLALELGDKIWPARALPFVRALAMLAAAGMCAFLFVLAMKSISAHHAKWVLNKAAEGENLSSELQVPRWALLVVLPYTFAVMTIRFLAIGAGALGGGSVAGEELLPGMAAGAASGEEAAP